MNLNFLFRKTTLIFCIILFIIYLGFIGCKKEESNPVSDVNTNYTEDDVAEIMGANISESGSTQGLTSQIDDAITVASGGKLSKLFGFNKSAFDTTIKRTKTGTYAYDFTFAFHTDFIDFGNTLTFDYKVKGTYEFPKIKGSDSALASIFITNIIAINNPNYRVSGLYSRFGAFELKYDNKNSITSILSITIDSIIVTKLSKKISSGNAVFQLQMFAPNGATKSFIGTIEFQGNSLAKVTVNGKSFYINLQTGVVTRATL